MSDIAGLKTVADDEFGEYHVLTERELEAKREEEAGLKWFPLRESGGGAVVRQIYVLDAAVLDVLPDAIQREVVRSMNRGSQQAGNRRPSEPTFAETKRNLARNQELADRLCCFAFVKPKLVMAADEHDGDPYTALVTKLHIKERQEFGALCYGTNEEVADRLKPFRPKPDTDVPDRTPQPVAAAPVEPAGITTIGL